MVTYLITKDYNGGAVVIIATLGNCLGACTTYLLGWYGREKYIEKYLRINPNKLEKSERLFKKYGSPVLLLSWFPVVGDGLVAIGGVLKLNFLIFSIYVFIGKFVRYLFVAYLAGITFGN
ncbi:MAG: VTT domain-containing protein [Methanosarcinales archaeon]|nr:VTT domain-containing protein [Methanosarcinales archaeon]